MKYEYIPVTTEIRDKLLAFKNGSYSAYITELLKK